MIISCWYCYLRTFPPNLQRVHRCNQGITCWSYRGTARSLSSVILRNMLCTCNKNFNICRLSQQFNHISCNLLCNHRIILLGPFLHIKVADACTIFFIISLCYVTSEYSLRTCKRVTDAIKKQLARWSYRATVRSFASVFTRNMLHTRNEIFMSTKPTIQSYLILASGMPASFLVNLIKSTLVYKRSWILAFFSIQLIDLS